MCVEGECLTVVCGLLSARKAVLSDSGLVRHVLWMLTDAEGSRVNADWLTGMLKVYQVFEDAAGETTSLTLPLHVGSGCGCWGEGVRVGMGED